MIDIEKIIAAAELCKDAAAGGNDLAAFGYADAIVRIAKTEVPIADDGLLIAALRHANDTSGTLNDIRAEVFRLLGDDADDPKYEELFRLLRLSLFEQSGLPLFITAHNLRIALPPDLSGADPADLVQGR